MKRLLEAHDSCVAFRAIADPDAHQPVQVPFADPATRGHIRDPHTPARVLDLMDRCGHNAVDLGVLQTLNEKTLQNVNAVRGCLERRWDSDELVKRRHLAQAERRPTSWYTQIRLRIKATPARRRTPTSNAGDVKLKQPDKQEGSTC
jgi:hypothetical protein